MNHKINPFQEYELMLNFFQTGGNLEKMPSDLKRIHTIWKRADELVRKYPYYNNEKLAEQLRTDFAELDLTLSIAKRHVTQAKKYFDFVETETPATHRRIITTILYKQIAMLEQQQFIQPSKADRIAQTIEKIAHRIAALNKVYSEEKEEAPEEDNDITFILSTDSTQFEDIPDISDAELYRTIDKITKVIPISPEEKAEIIAKDVKNKIL